VAEEEAVKCNECGQTWSVQEFGNGCPGCRPRGVGKKEKEKRLKDMETEAQGADTTEGPDLATSSPPLAQGEPLESLTADSPLNDSEPLLQCPRTSTRDKEATKRHNVELKLSCRSTNVSKVKVSQVQVSIGLLIRSALPEEIVARSGGEDVKDTVFTVPLLRDCIINMIHYMEKDNELP